MSALDVTTVAAADTTAIVDRVHRRALQLEPSMWAGLAPGARRRRIAELVRADAPLLGNAAAEVTIDRILARLGGLGPLEPLLDDPSVTEVMVNGGGDVWIERAGRLLDTPVRVDEALVLQLIERIVAPLGLRIDRSSPIVDARLADGSRINAIIRPIAVDGPCLTIRRFGVRRVGLDAFASTDVQRLLQWAITARLNVLVSGGTGSGKTTLLNALASAIPRGERLITIEDTAELQLPGDHVVRLEARPANAEGAGRLGVRELVRNALRMRPDRIIVGEVRGDEALDMLQAMNTGHEGSMSTCHANSARDALRRIETMVLMGADDVPLAAIREQVASSIDLVVHVARRPDGTRAIAEVHEVAGAGGDTRVLVERGVLVHPPSRGPRSLEVAGTFDDGSRR